MENSQRILQMRRVVEKNGVSTEKYGDLTMMRFLIARSMDVEKAAKMFVQWQKWRDTMVPNGRIDESEIEDELEARKIYLQGLSQNGHSVMIVKGSKHFPAKDQVQFKKYVVYALDKTISSAFQGREIGNEKLIGILDLQQISYKNIDPRGLITGFQFLQAYYPERLAKCYILNMPRFFISVWRMVSRFLEKVTLEKIVIVSNEEERKSMIEEIGEEVLPAEYGGKGKLIALQDAVLPHLDG
ncbi:SEC14 cytosolic factor isoform X1 [Cucurbita pepo subsp. pepo]|uniref:SEC14 cytosolic factor isoform X1 n=2 Tax=Cucurbita pepo subsp. pepo TaxID=3664 RepID=UPI000C9D3742|nr:SEC14 cytosolic factor isoform X1 [Cucurbita pepo subsp. pepo]XP_023513858.1 SEC14 cytosolic factor isoform X1 [Cucurbita pepo subsp. pepo]XP_023513865.1 SEC14 cytosolic factor isoform X1 [Cucurbita pepo subsp. pepo]